jgi:hypothetical protein
MYPPHSLLLEASTFKSPALFRTTISASREGETGPAELASMLNQHLDWETKFKTKAEDLDGAVFSDERP